MFEVGQLIIYGGNGVCEIEEIVMRSSPVLGDKQNYVIKLASGLTAYVPIDSTIFMRALISPEEANAVISEYPSLAIKSYLGTNSKALSDQYRSIIARHDPRELLCLYKSLKQKINNAVANGKKPGTMDDRAAMQALDSVIDEFRVVLNATREDLLYRLGIQ